MSGISASSLMAFLFAAALAAQGPAETAAEDALREFGRYSTDRNPHVRRAAVDDLGAVDHVLVTRALLKAFGDSDAGVRAAVGRALARQRNELGLAELTKLAWRGRELAIRLAILDGWIGQPPKHLLSVVEDLLDDRAWPVRERAALLIADYGDEEGRGTGALEPLLKDSEVAVRLAALASLRRLAHSKSNRMAIPLLEDKDWRVKASAIQLLRELRDAVSIEPLIATLEREEGRLIDDVHEALKDLTDRQFPADAARWRTWWETVKVGFRVPTKEEIAARRAKEARAAEAYDREPRPPYPPYHGIRTRSKKLLFVLDISASMADRVTIDERNAEEVKSFEERYGTSRIKIEIARDELIDLVAKLEPPASFNILLFNSEVERLEPALVPATAATKNKAIKWLTKLTPDFVAPTDDRAAIIRGETNTHAALQAAFDIVSGPDPLQGSIKTAADTIFFLSDGRPSTGAITEPQLLVDWIRGLNRRAKIVMHTISFGQENRALMEMIAQDSGGQAVSIGR